MKRSLTNPKGESFASELSLFVVLRNGYSYLKFVGISLLIILYTEQKGEPDIYDRTF